MICTHSLSVFNPDKWNYTHAIYYTNGDTHYAIVHQVPLEMKELADAIATQENKAIRLMHEILPDGEVVQELDLVNCKHERFIAHSTAAAKRAAMCQPVEFIASVI